MATASQITASSNMRGGGVPKVWHGEEQGECGDNKENASPCSGFLGCLAKYLDAEADHREHQHGIVILAVVVEEPSDDARNGQRREDALTAEQECR